MINTAVQLAVVAGSGTIEENYTKQRGWQLEEDGISFVSIVR